jgi:hypothetical protein
VKPSNIVLLYQLIAIICHAALKVNRNYERNYPSLYLNHGDRQPVGRPPDHGTGQTRSTGNSSSEIPCDPRQTVLFVYFVCFVVIIPVPVRTYRFRNSLGVIPVFCLNCLLKK